MSVELIHALDQLEREKGVNKEILMQTIEAALLSAYKRNFGSVQNVKIAIDRQTGDVKVFALKKVTSAPENHLVDISVADAKKINENLEEEDIAEIEVTPKKFGRIAAQTAKQVVVQRIREAERGIIFDEYYNKEDDIVTGIVQRMERRNIIIDLGRTEAVLPPVEQAPGEVYHFNERLKTYIIEVRKTPKGPQIIVSRTHPGLVRRLFELEVPEIHEGIVDIKSISREPGSRTKIAVSSRDANVDPIGACVGQKGTRVQAIVDELKGEKIDIIKWSSSAEEFISSSLSPAKVLRVDTDEESKTARVIVPDYQLSLAIGKEGQNARLAAKLTGWKIDIKSESQFRAMIEEQLLNYNEAQDETDDEADDEAIDETVDQADGEAVDDTVDETIDEPIDEPVDEPVDQAADETQEE